MKIDLVKLLSKRELIAGLEISDDFLRLILLDMGSNNSVFIKALAEEPIPSGVITNGVLKDEAQFGESLKKLLATAGTSAGGKIKNIIVSIADVNVYSKVFSFPKAITGAKLTEAMKVTAGFNLPVNTADVYLDWETIPAENDNELYLSTVPKTVVDPYLKIFTDLRLNPIAFEPRILSIVRIMNLDGEKPNLITFREKSFTEFVIAKGRSVRFIHFINRQLNEAEMAKEANKISSFYEVEDTPVGKIINGTEIDLPDKFKSDPRLKNGGKHWLTSLGAAIRGLLPRNEDTLISLMPIGTEAAYESQKQTILIKALSDMTIAMAGVISIAFLGVWILMLGIQAKINNGDTTNTPLPTNAVKTEAKANQFNAVIATISGISKQTPKWSILFDAVRATIPTGITITSLSVTNPQELISMTGVAKSRTDLNKLTDMMGSSTVFTGFQFPLTDLAKRDNISFNATMKLKNPDILTSSTNQNNVK